MLRSFICGTSGLRELKEYIESKVPKNYMVELLVSEEAQVIQVIADNALVFDARLSQRTRETYLNLQDPWVKEFARSELPIIENIIDIFEKKIECKAREVVIAYSYILDTMYILIHPINRCSALRVAFGTTKPTFEVVVSNCRVSSEEIQCDSEHLVEILKNIASIAKDICR